MEVIRFLYTPGRPAPYCPTLTGEGVGTRVPGVYSLSGFPVPRRGRHRIWDLVRLYRLCALDVYGRTHVEM